MEDIFFSIAEDLRGLMRGEEMFLASFAGEESDFVRFNKSAVRQASSVVQRSLTIDLVEGSRHAVGELTLSADPAEDRTRLRHLIGELRAMREFLPDDPHLIFATDAPSTTCRRPHEPVDSAQVVREVRRNGSGHDLVGVFASGSTFAGFASSFGQRNWYENYSHNLDWSLHLDGDRAVKASYAGFEWRDAEFDAKARATREQLRVLRGARRLVEPGRYPVYLTPSALYEMVQLLSWGGFGLRAHRTKATPLLKMVEDGARLNPAIKMAESPGAGIAPNFQEGGFLRADEVVLVDQGAYRDCLVSPRSAKEYSTPTNGACEAERPMSLDVAAGDIATGSALTTLGRGIYVSNLWYLNFSDRAACRTTGMTRFATFWVENGIIQQPLEVMRFDETLFRMLGENLIGLTADRELLLDPGTYGRRSTDSANLPGALIDDFTFTL